MMIGKDERLRKLFRPPEGESWIWRTKTLLESPAWRARSLHLMRLIERIEYEHLLNGGRENGLLIVTYDDFAAAGIPRRYVAATIAEGEALGLIEVQRRGRSARNRSFPLQFGLTWHVMRRSRPNYQDGKPFYERAPPNSWRTISVEKAAAIRERIDSERREKRNGRKSALKSNSRSSHVASSQCHQ